MGWAILEVVVWLLVVGVPVLIVVDVVCNTVLERDTRRDIARIIRARREGGEQGS